MTDKIIAEIIFIKRYLCVIGTFPFIIRYAAAVCDCSLSLCMHEFLGVNKFECIEINLNAVYY